MVQSNAIQPPHTASIIMATAKGFQPWLIEIVNNLPEGSKALVAERCNAQFVRMMTGMDVTCCFQSESRGTAEAIRAVMDFIHPMQSSTVIISTAEMPFIKNSTYRRMATRLNIFDMVVLGFEPPRNKGYGVFEIEDGRVFRHTDWMNGTDRPFRRPGILTVCNAGIYAVKRDLLLFYLNKLADRPRTLHREINSEMCAIQVYPIADIIKLMVSDGRSVGCLVVEDHLEMMDVYDAREHWRRQRHCINAPMGDGGWGVSN